MSRQALDLGHLNTYRDPAGNMAVTEKDLPCPRPGSMKGRHPTTVETILDILESDRVWSGFYTSFSSYV